MKRGGLVFSVLCVLCVLCAFSGFSPSAQAKSVKLTFSHFWAAGHPVSESLAEWGKEVEKRTKGSVTVVMFPGATLTPADKCYDGVVKGISTMGSSALSYTRGRFPLMEVTDLPLGYKNAMAATKLANAIYKKFHPKELDDVEVMFFHGTGPQLFHTRQPVRTLEDLRGMKIRTTGLGAKIVTALGATPVAMPMGDTYDALSKGVVEGSTAPIASLEGFKWGEVVKYTTENFGTAYTTIFFVVMNKKAWNSLTPENQKIIEQVNTEWIDRIGKVQEKYDLAGREFTIKLGNKIIPLSKQEDERWVKKVKVTIDDYVRDTKAKNLPGDEVVKFAIDNLKKMQ